MTKNTQKWSEMTFEIEDQQESSPELDLHTIAAILMFAVIQANGDVHQMEIAEMVTILRKNYDMSMDETTTLMTTARKAINDDVEIGRLTGLLRKKWTRDEREQLVIDLWEIAAADNTIHGPERDMIDTIADDLNVAKEKRKRAQYLAENRLEFNIS